MGCLIIQVFFVCVTAGYMQIISSGTIGGETAWLVSPLYNSSEPACLSFFLMSTQGNTVQTEGINTLKIYVSKETDPMTGKQIWQSGMHHFKITNGALTTIHSIVPG